MHFIGLDIHKKTISYCVKDVSGTILSEGTVAATRAQLDDESALIRSLRREPLLHARVERLMTIPAARPAAVWP